VVLEPLRRLRMLLMEEDTTDESDKRLGRKEGIASPVHGTTFNFSKGTLAFVPSPGDIATRELATFPQFEPGGDSRLGDSSAAMAALRSRRMSEPASVPRLCSLFPGVRGGSGCNISAILGVSPRSLWIFLVWRTNAARCAGSSLFEVNSGRSASDDISYRGDGSADAMRGSWDKCESPISDSPP
jgi:hypothetical protein